MNAEMWILAALAAYAAAFVMAVAGLRCRPAREKPWQLILVALGVLFQTAGIGRHCHESATHYFTSGTEILWLLAWAAGINYLLVLAAWRMRALGVLILPLNAGLLAASFLFTYPGPAPLGELHRHPLYPVHVLSAFLGYGFFMTACAASLLYLRAEWLLKHKLFTVFFQEMPSLERIERSAARSVWVGLALFTVALGLGGYLCWRQGLTGWYGLPKILVAEATWLIFAVLAAGRLAGRLVGRTAAKTILAGAALVAATILIGHPFRASGAEDPARTPGEVRR
jgi:ABC-type uncharacterized transport system permease subunit